MNKLRAYLLFVFIFFSSAAMAQTGDPAQDTTNPAAATVPDTTVLKTTLVDTVSHVYNVDSLDKEKKLKDQRDLLKMSAIQSENDKIWIRKQIEALSGKNMRGRGYVKNGTDSAALFVLKKFKEFKLKSVGTNQTFTQGFAFPVNTFPNKMKLVVNGDSLKPGTDYLIDPSSSSFFSKELKVKKVNLNDIADREAWKIILSQMDAEHLYYLENVDLFCSKILNVKRSVFLSMLPRGSYIIPQEGRLQWSVSRDTITATIFYVHPDALPKVMKSAEVAVTAEFLPKFRNQNIVGCIPGVVKDSFIAFTAHFDHLGMMGKETVFAGASENASSIAMLLYLASYYAHHTPHYSILFVAFSGEEASLMGSEFFVKKPIIPIRSIKFLTNLDMMADATNGITVVNATEHPTEFGLLKAINDREKYVSEVRSRGPAANSDHYYFAKAGVPAFFIYANGLKNYYHDVADKPREISANKVDGVAKLLIAFAAALN
jgi:hypothetical protein